MTKNFDSRETDFHLNKSKNLFIIITAKEFLLLKMNEFYLNASLFRCIESRLL